MRMDRSSPALSFVLDSVSCTSEKTVSLGVPRNGERISVTATVMPVTN